MGRTVISGETRPHDFEPSFLGSGVGRIFGERHGPSEGNWFWSISMNDKRWRVHGGQGGRSSNKEEPVAELEQVFTTYPSDTPPKPSPYAQVKGGYRESGVGLTSQPYQF